MSLEPTRRTVRTPSLDLACEEYGEPTGRPIVLLHGFPYSPRAYGAVAPELAAKGMRVIAPFLRGFGPTRFLDPGKIRSGEQAALGQDLLDLIAALQLERPLVAGFDWGGRAACIAAATAPDIVRGLLTCANYNIMGQPITQPLPPALEHKTWYQYLLHTDRGRDMLAHNRRDFCKYLWQSWSPTWSFDDATFEASAQHFDNPDFVDTVLHSYRHRYGLVAGDPAYAALAAKLVDQPSINIPAVLLWADQSFLPPVSERDLQRFVGPFVYREMKSVGHNPPQESPAAFVDAILALDQMAH